MRRTIAAVVALSAVTAALAGAGAARAAAPPVERALAGSVPAFTSHAAATGAVAGSRRLTIQLWLAPRTAAAAAYATEVATPGSALYGRYLSPAQYTARFGATAAEAASVQAWLRSAGFSGISADAQRDYVRATAPVSAIDAAFKTQLRYYQSSASATAGSNRLYANDSAADGAVVAGGQRARRDGPGQRRADPAAHHPCRPGDQRRATSRRSTCARPTGASAQGPSPTSRTAPRPTRRCPAVTRPASCGRPTA